MGFTPFSSLIRNINRPSYSKYNILTFSCHERYQSIQARTGHNFFLVPSQERHTWNTNYAEIPDNIKQIDGIEFGGEHTFDLILSHTPDQTYNMVPNISKQFKLPHIALNHCLRQATGNVAGERYWRNLAKNSPADWHVFITEAQRKDWYFDDHEKSEVILHGIDSNIFRGYVIDQPEKSVLIVANDLINRGHVMGWDLIQQSCDGLPVRFVGDTKLPNGEEFSKPTSSVPELAQVYRLSTIYLNTARLTTISTSMLEAMATGMPVVSYPTLGITDFFENERDILLADNPKDIRQRLDFLLDNQEARVSLGMMGRKAVLEKFNITDHCNAWNNLFNRMVQYDTNR